jgi:signal transduction histidine kinase
VRDWLWRGYLGAGVAVGIVYFALPGVDSKDVVYVLIAASSVVATLWTALRGGSANRGPRLVLGAGLALWLGGEVFWNTYEIVLRRPPPYPSIADAMYLSAYPLFAVALVRLIGGLRANRAALIEAVAVAAGAGAATWVLFADRFFHTADGAMSKVVAVASPAADILLLGALTCAFLLPGRTSTATRWLLAGVVATLLADLAYSMSELANAYETGAWLDAGWLCFYVTWGVAALHPTMDDPPVKRRDPVPRYGRRRLVVLLAAGLLPPATLAEQVFVHRRLEVPVLAVMCVVTFSLVAARIASLWRLAERDASVLAERKAELESVLSRLQELQRQRRELLRETVRAAEEERMRVSAEIHDGPVQKLTAMALRAGALERRMGLSGPDDARTGVAAIHDELGLQIAELRRVIADLRPPELDRGLPAALRELVDGFGRRTGSVALLDAEGDGRALPEIETILFRVTQEALSNVAKHAGAREVRVTVLVRPDVAGVTIRDDGRGFAPPMNGELVREGHFGLAGMRERVEAAGGTFAVTSSPGAGTQIVARIPCARPGDGSGLAASAGVVPQPLGRFM